MAFSVSVMVNDKSNTDLTMNVIPLSSPLLLNR